MNHSSFKEQGIDHKNLKMKVKLDINFEKICKFLFFIIVLALSIGFLADDFIKQKYMEFMISFLKGDLTSVLNGFFYSMAIISVGIMYYMLPILCIVQSFSFMIGKTKLEKEKEKAIKEIEKKHKKLYHQRKLDKLNKKKSEDEK